MFKKRILKNNTIDIDKIKQQQQQSLQQCQQPKKKVKISKISMNTIISASTQHQKINLQNSVHQQFQSINSNKPPLTPPQNLPILLGQQAINHQTQQIKQKYLQNIQITKKIKQGKLSTKIYRGMNSYANYQLSQNQLNNPLEYYKFRHGPTRSTSNTNTKNTCRFDYDPSLCKDWHDSGYCVFGNSCIYLHDRSNCKTGWQLQKDFQKSQRQRWKRLTNPNAPNDTQDHLKDLQKYKPQQTCKVCSQFLKNPVQVSCTHIYCRNCAIQIFDKDSKCIQCNKKLNGIMNNAEKLLKKQKQNYQLLIQNNFKNKQLINTSKNIFKNINPLNVFTAQ